MKFKKKILIFLVTVTVILLFGSQFFLPQANLKGFCWIEKRFLTDEELIYRLVEKINKQDFFNLYVLNEAGAYLVGDTVYDIIPYENAADFLSANPDCCNIKKYSEIIVHGKEVDSHEYSQQGLYAGTFYIRHKVKYMKEGEEKEGIAIHQGMVTNCGDEFTPFY